MIVSEGALYRNAAAIRAAIPRDKKLMCVVKADAYGHGSVNAARAMLRAGADAFAVAIVEEAEVLRAAGIAAPILILGGAADESLAQAVCADAAQAVYDAHTLDVLQRAAVENGKTARAHLKIDSGMTRIGVRGADDLRALLSHWRKRCPDVRMEGIFTHFCAAESDMEFTLLQNERFRRAIEIVREHGFDPICHAAATTAMCDPRFQYNMVRAGIALYGSLGGDIPVCHAQQIVCKPLRIETIAIGDTVGYGRTFTAKRETRVMTLPIGYGDGYPRALSNRADVLVAGRRAHVIGNVCMDMMMADVTDIPEADDQSDVVIMGSQGCERITPDELAAICGTIPYEIMLGFSARLTRKWGA